MRRGRERNCKSICVVAHRELLHLLAGQPVERDRGLRLYQGSPGFDIVTRTHVEGQAAALMQRQGIGQGILYINNPAICTSCTRNLPYMLELGRSLEVVPFNGISVPFTGVSR